MAQAAPETEVRPSPASIIGANIFRLRVLQIPKLSQETLAERAGISVNTLAPIENARDITKRQPNAELDTLEAIARALGVRLGELFREDEASRVFLQGEPSLSLLPGGRLGPSTGAVPLLASARS